VDAFNDALAGCSKTTVDKFTQQLTDVVGENGMKAGEEVHFMWLNGGGIQILKNGKFQEPINDPEVETRLLEVYIDKSRTVSKELVKSFESNIDKVQ
jgi:hypothetical protein